MLERLMQKDKNEKLEKILEEKEIEEHAKNLLQSILYKIEVSYKDCKKVKVIEKSKNEYIEDILKNIQKRCKQIKIVKLSESLDDEQKEKELRKNKFYIDKNEIICYPIEEKILFAIEKKSNNEKIVSNRYKTIAKPLSNLINSGKNINRLEVLRDFNGWSWTTIKSEIENIQANLIFQTLQIIFGEKFLEDWSNDIDGIIDYVDKLKEKIEIINNVNLEENFYELLSKISIINEYNQCNQNKKVLEMEYENIQNEIENYNSLKDNISKIYERKKEIIEEIKNIDKILSQESELKKEYERLNKNLDLENKIFSIKVLKENLIEKKQKLLNEVEENNNILKPENYLKEKEEKKKKKDLLYVIKYSNQEQEEVYIEFLKICLYVFEKKIENCTEEEIIKLIYKLRYLMLVPFNEKNNVYEINELKEPLLKIEHMLLEKGIKNKILSENIPFEVIQHVFRTRIINLEELYYKITKEDEKYYVQIFDENITEEKFEIQLNKKSKINKKVKIFI